MRSTDPGTGPVKPVSSRPGALRVLLVDDDEVDREAVRRALAKANIDAEVTESADPVVALSILKKNPFDVVILDHHFPRHDGLFLLREMREIGSRIPVIALTGLDESALAVELMKNGAADFLPKAALTPQRLALGIRNAQRLGASELATRAVQDALHASEELNKRLFELSSDAIEVLDPEGRLLSLNPAAQRLLEIPDPATLRLRPWLELWDDAQRNAAAVALNEALAGRIGRVVGRCRGTQAWRTAAVAALASPDGRTERLVAVSSQIDPSKIAG